MRRLFSVAKKLRKPKHVEKSVSGVFYRPEKKVLHLKKKPPLVEFHFIKDVKIFFERPRNRKNVLVIVSVLLSFSILTSFFRTYATVVTFYPKTCLGGWEHPEYATGKSTLADDASQSYFNHENSAFTKDKTTTLYCGDFSGEIPVGTDPKHFELSFSWSIDNGTVVHYESQPFDVPANIEGGSVEPAPVAPQSIDVPIDGPIPSQSGDASVLTAPIEVPAEAPTSFFQDFFAQKVFAQDVTPTVEVVDAGGMGEVLVVPTPLPGPSTTESGSTKTEVTPEPSVSVDQGTPPTELTPAPVVETPTAFVDNASYPKGTTPPTAAELSGVGQTVSIDDAYNADKADGFMEVLYTIDGTNWKDLGTVSQNAWHGIKFEIPLSGWEDLSHFQVALKTLSTVDVSPAIYLDSIRLEVAYDDAVEKVTPPTIMLKDGVDIIEGAKDFASGEEPLFTITDPGYSSFDVNNLVGNEKAEVLEDPDKVVSTNEVTKENIEQTKSTIEEIKNFFSPPPSDAPSLTAPVSNDTPATDTEAALKILAPSAEVPSDDSSPAPPKTTIFDTTQPTSFLNIFQPLVAKAEDAELNPPIEATVINNKGENTDIPVIVETTYVGGRQKNTLHIKKPERSFRPGHYTLKVKMYTAGATIVTQQDFTWGVLAVNIDRTIYRPGDIALVQFGVLLDSGDTVCDANIDFSIKDPRGGTYSFTTTDGTIVRDEKCGPNNVIDVPDYYAHFPIPNIPGQYTMTATSHTASGTRTVTDHFEVQPSVSFDIERKSATRIYPGSTYPVILEVTSTEDWSGIIIDKTPASFKITPRTHTQTYDSTVIDGDTQTISWNVTLKKGETTTLGYTYKAPFISPEFYLLGKAVLTDGSGSVSFSETRNWQIASDVACNATTSGAWSAPATWSAGCSGAGGIPATGDDITINSGVTVTGDTTATVNSMTIASATAGNGLSINTGITVTVTNAITYNANAGTGNQTVTMNGTADLSAGSITINSPTNTGNSVVTCAGGATGTLTVTNAIAISGNNVNTGKAALDMLTCTLTANGLPTLTGFGNGVGTATITSSTGTINLNAGITFAGGAQVGNAKIITSGTATINITGTITGAGTLSLTAGTLALFTGTSAINAAFTTWKSVEIVSGTTTLGAAQTFTGLNVDSGATLAGSTFLSTVACTGTGINSLTVDGTLSGSGGITITTGTCTITGAGSVTNTGTLSINATTSIASAANITLQNTTIAIAAATVLTNNGTVTTTGASGITGGNAGSTWTNAAGSTLNFGGGTTTLLATGTLTATASTNTVNYNLAGAQTCKVVTYNALTLSGSGAKTCAVTTVQGNMTVGGTATWTTGAALVISGTLTVSGGTLTKGAFAFQVNGATTVSSGSILCGSATGGWTFTGQVSTTGTGIFNIVTTPATLSLGGGLSSGGGTFNTGTGATTLTATQAFAGSVNMTIGAAISVPTTKTLTLSNTATITFTGAITMPVGSPNLVVNNGTSASVTTTSLTFTANSTAGGAQLVTLAANSRFRPTAITMPATTSTGTAKITSSGSGALLAVTNATALTASATASGGLTSIDFTGQDTTFNTGTLAINGGIAGNATVIMGSGTLTTTTTLSVSNAAASGAFTASLDCSSSSGNVTVGTTTAITVAGTNTAARVAKVVMGSGQFTGGGLVTVTGPTSGASIASIQSTNGGKLDFGAGLTLAGTTIANAQLITTTAATIELTGALTGAGTFTFAASTIFQTVGTSSFASAFTLPANATFNVLSGTHTLASAIITIAGPTNVTGTLQNASGNTQKNFTGLVTVKSGGSFNMNVGTLPPVSFAGGIAIDQGATAFNATGTITFITNNQSIANGSGTPALSPLTFGATTITTNTITLTQAYTGGTVRFASLNLVSPTAAYGLNLNTGTVTTTTGAVAFAANASAGAFDEDIILNGTATLSIGTTLTMAAPTTTVAGATEGIFAATSAAGSVTISGATTITGGATGTQFCGIDLSASSTATTSLTAAAVTLSGGAAGVAGITMDTGNLTFNGAFAGAGTTANSRLVTGANTILFANGSSMSATVSTLTIASATFNTSGTVALSGAYTLPNLNVLSGTTTMGAVAITITGATDITGTLANSTGAQLKTFTGLVTVNSGGSFSLNTATAPAVTFSGGITIDQGAVAVAISGATSFTTNSQSISDGVAGAGSWPNISFGATTITGINLTQGYDQGTVTFGTVGLTNGTTTQFTLATGTTTISGALTLNSSVAVHPQTVTLQGTASYSPSAITLPASLNSSDNFMIVATGNATLTVSGATSITGSSSTGATGLSAIDFSGTAADFTTGALSVINGSQGSAKVIMGTGTLTTNGLLTINNTATGLICEASVTTNSGIIDINAGLSFTGPNLTTTKLITTGAATINFTGTMTGLGVLTFDPATSFVTVGTAAFASAYTIPAISVLSITAGTTSITATPFVTNAPLSVSSGGTLEFKVASGAFTANSTTGVSGTITCNTTANLCGGLKKFIGLLTINSGGGAMAFDLSNAVTTAPTTEFQGGITMNGTTFAAGSGTASFTTSASQTITGSTLFFSTVSVAVSKTVINNGIVDIDTLLTGTGTWQQDTSSELDFSGVGTTPLSSGIIFDATTNTPNLVDFKANSQTVVATDTFYNLTFSNQGGTTVGDTINPAIVVTVNGTLTLLGGATDGTELDSYGTLTMGQGSTMTGAGGAVLGIYQPQTGVTNTNIGGSVTSLTFDNTGAAGSPQPVVTYNYTGGAQTVFPTTYYDLVIATTGQIATLGTGTTTANNSLTISSGTLDTGSQALSANTITESGGNFTLGSSAVTLTGTGTVFNRTAGTVTAGTSIITLSDTSNTAKTFAGGGQTFYDLVLAPGAATGASLYTISGSNTFNDFQDTGTAAHGILFTTGTTTTVTTFTVAGTVGNLVTINSTTTGTHALVKAGGGTISSDYLNIQHSVATPSSTWYAGTHSTNNQGTATAGSGWIFTGVPSGISISGTGSSSNSGATVKVAVNGTLRAQTAVVGGGGAWTINSVTAPSAGDVVTVWVDAVAQSNESTAITKYTSGNISGMDLSLNTLTVGSDQNQSMVVSDFNQYSCINDEDVMQDVVSNVLNVSGDGSCAGGAQSYTDPIIVLLASNPLTVGTSETLLTGLIDINASSSLTATGSATIELNGTSGTLFTNSGSFSGGNSLVKFTGNSSPVLFAGSFTGGNSLYDLEVSPALTSGTKIYGSGVAVDAANNFTIDPSGGGGTAFHYNLGGIHTISGTILLQPTGGATAQIDTTGSSYDITANNISLQTASTMNCNNSTITLTGTSGTLLTNSGTFNEDTSTVIVASASGTPTLLAGATTFHRLDINPGATVVNAGSAITFDTTTSPTNPRLYVGSFAVFNDGGNQITGTVGSIVVDQLGTFCLGGTPAATNATCNNTATATTATTFPGFASVTLDATSTVIYNANAATTISVQSYGNLSMLPVLTTARAYNFASGAVSVAADFTISDTGSGLLTVNMNGDITVGFTTTIAGATATSSLVTGATPYNLTSGLLAVNAGGKLDCAGSTATITLTIAPPAGAIFTLAGTFTPGSSNVVFSGNGAATLNAGSITFYDMTSSGTGVKSVASATAFTINHTLTVSNGTFNPNGTTITAAVGPNAISVSSGATLDVDGTTFGGSYSGFGIPTITLASGSTVDYNRAGNQTIESALTYSNLTVSGGSGTKKPNNTLTVGADLSAINSATFDTDSVGNYAVNTNRLVFQNGNVTANASLITVSGTSGVPILYSAGTFTSNTSTVIYTGNNPGGTTTIETGITYYNLTVNNTSETYVLSNNLSLSSAGTLTITNGTFDTVSAWSINAGHINLAGSVTAVLNLRNSTVNLNATTGPAALITKVGAAGTFTAGTSIVNFNGTASVTATSGNFINANSFATLTSSNSGTFTFGGQVTATTLLQAGQGTIDTGNQQVKANSIVIGTAGTLVAGISTIEVTGTSLPVFTRSGSGVFTASNSIVRMTGNANIGAMFSGAFTGGNAFNNLSFEPALTTSPSYSLDMTNIGIGGSLLFAPSAVSTNTMTVTMLSNITTGTAPGSLGISGVTSGSTSLDMNGHTISTGDVTIGGTDTLIAGPTITVAGSWTNGGTFTHSNGTVTLNSGTTATVTGTTTFYDLSITHTSAKEVDFTASGGTPTFTVANAFTVTGHVGQLIKLYSTASPTQWDFLPTGTAAVDYADVMDGGCHAGAISITPTNSIDSGNNGTCWSFGAAVTFDIDVSPTGVASSAPYSVPLGILSTAAVTKSDNSSINMIVLNGTTSSSGGMSITVQNSNGGNGLVSLSVPGDKIPSATTTMSAGTANYGLCVDSATLTGFTRDPAYVTTCAISSGTNAVVGLTAAPAAIVGSSGSVANGQAKIVVNAAISPVTPAHNDYKDTLTFIATANF